MAFKILVVDDEPDVELLIRQRFRRKIRDGEFEFEFEFAVANLAAKPLPDQQLHIRLVIHDKNLECHSLPRERNDEFRVLAWFRLHADLSVMLLYDDLIAHREAEPR